MFGKKRQIKRYLAEKKLELYSQFDYVLDDFINKQLKKKLFGIGLSRIEIHVDWYLGLECSRFRVHYRNRYITNNVWWLCCRIRI
jgi:hypothetical protein